MHTQTDFEMIEVTSSNIAAIGYDRKSKILRIRFHDGGAVYEYAPFSPGQWKEFRQAESTGRYFADFIRPVFRARRVEG